MVEVLVVAWDGAPSELEEWGGLPCFRDLCRTGAKGLVQSTIPPVTAPAWATFHTGANPGKHGVFGWAVRRPDGYLPALADSRSIALPTLWELANECSVGLIGFPLTYPPRKVDGFWVPGFLAPPGAQGFPPGIETLVRKTAPKFSFTPPDWTRAIDPTAWAKELVDFAMAKTRAAIALAREFQPNLFGIHFQVTDLVQHYLWGREEVQWVFSAVDSALGELISALSPRWIVLLSDHGMGPVVGEFYVNTWLWREGFLRLRRRPATTLRKVLFQLGFTPRGMESLLLGLYPLARRLGFVHSPADLWAHGPLSRMGRMAFLTLADVDWRKTWAYSYSEIGTIFLNRVGREPQGIVKPKDAPRVLADLAQGLRELSLPNGNPLCEKLFLASELYWGAETSLGPDLIFLPAKLEWMGKGLGGFLHNRVFHSALVAAGHRLEGVIVISGEGVEPTEIRAELWDIAPTILALVGIPIPTWMDGRPLVEAFAQRLRPKYARQELSQEKSYTADVVERLRGFGYL